MSLLGCLTFLDSQANCRIGSYLNRRLRANAVGFPIYVTEGLKDALSDWLRACSHEVRAEAPDGISEHIWRIALPIGVTTYYMLLCDVYWFLLTTRARHDYVRRPEIGAGPEEFAVPTFPRY